MTQRASEINPTWYVLLLTYFSYFNLILVGRIRDFFRHLWDALFGIHNKHLAPIYDDWESFYTRRLYRPISHCWNRPINSTPGAWISVMERGGDTPAASFELTGTVRRLLNLGSYNYLGFAQRSGPIIDKVEEAIQTYSPSLCCPRARYGNTRYHLQLEQEVADFLQKDSALIFGMGFATNSSTLPVLLGPGCLIISDSLNHRSLVVGSRSSHAVVKVFRHNDLEHLEEVIRTAIVQGQPKTRWPWKKILIIVEGIYSMEGDICLLQPIVALKNKYKCYLYLDEAHSIGALGKTGRGVTEQLGVPTSEIDVMMGTFTKSFGSIGGYIAGSKDLITYLRTRQYATLYDHALSVPCVVQALEAFKEIRSNPQRCQQLRDNSNHMRTGLKRLGFAVGGDDDSPIIPVMVYVPMKMMTFSTLAMQLGLALVVVGFPATSITHSRARLCMSAAHTKEDIDFALKQFDTIGDYIGLKYFKENGKCDKHEE